MVLKLYVMQFKTHTIKFVFYPYNSFPKQYGETISGKQFTINYESVLIVLGHYFIELYANLQCMTYSLCNFHEIIL